MSRQPWNRLIAWGIDWLCVSAWVAVIAAVAVPLSLAGVTGGLSLVALNVLGDTVLVIPVTICFAWLESSDREATIGKRRRGLKVVDADTGSRVPLRRTLLRNALKIAVPWIIGHAVVYEIFQTNKAGHIPRWVGVATAGAYILPAVYAVSLFVGQGRTPYDWVSRTAVSRSDSAIPARRE